MEFIGNLVIYIIMACALAGAIASIVDDENGLGKEFLSGLYTIGIIFVPVAGIMAAQPYVSMAIPAIFGPAFAAVGADPSIAATTFIAVDMGGYQLADALARSREDWIIAMVVGYLAGATIIFSIPIGLTMLKEADHPYMALGVMAGFLSIPVGALVAGILLVVTNPVIRDVVSTNADATFTLAIEMGQLLANLIPLVVICGAFALGLAVIPGAMIRGFLIFGKVLTAVLRIVLVLSIIEYFTGAFSTIFGGWGFDPIIADEADQFRALELAGYIGIMLAGAFPMVYLITRYLSGPMEAMGKRLGLQAEGAAGLVAACANIIALFRLIEDMTPRDKVLTLSFAVCGAFLFGDHLAFTANFQPSLIVIILLGKLGGAIAGFYIALYIAVPRAEMMYQTVRRDMRVPAE
ncbi:MAG: ethanolamine utilization protein EutH [Aliihoeflea sp.]